MFRYWEKNLEYSMKSRETLKKFGKETQQDLRKIFKEKTWQRNSTIIEKNDWGKNSAEPLLKETIIEKMWEP